MKRILTTISLLLGLASASDAQIVKGVRVDSLRINRSGEYLAVDMDFDLSDLEVESNRAVLLTPQLVNGADTLAFPSIGIYGRQRYFYYVRNGESMLRGKEEISYRASEKPDGIPYTNVIPYEEWMNGAYLSLNRCVYGCCGDLLSEENAPLLQYAEKVFVPEYVYIIPEAEKEKIRSLKGQAFVDFPVNKTVIYPEYRNNVEELGKIQATIDSVRDDADVTITSVTLKGYASPEGSYTNNTRLAVGRTDALKEHIRQLYNFNEGVIAADYEPEDWEGLREYVEKSNIDNKEHILAIIDSDLEPDPKDGKIKRTYPQEYAYLLKHCYPALRHTDYVISYSVRSYTDVAEIGEIMKKQPQKLSLNEFYLVAQQYEPGSDDFTEVFETAVRMFPDDEVANLNAANAAMVRNNLDMTKRYLDRAGNSPEAVYARGVYAFLTEDYEAAKAYLTEAGGLGIAQSRNILDYIENK